MSDVKAEVAKAANAAAEGSEQAVRSDISHDPVKAVLIAFAVGIALGVVLAFVV